MRTFLRDGFCRASLLFLLTAVSPLAQSQNSLSQLAASLSEGEWSELQTNNIGVLNQNGTDGNIITYAGDAAWDPNSRKLLYVGNDHIDSRVSEADRFVIYSADNNTWQDMAPPPWSEPGVTDHGYYQHGLDPATGTLYRRKGKSSGVFGAYSVASDTWSSTPNDGDISGSSCCSGADYFPELGGLVHAQGGEPGGGSLRLLQSDGQWVSLADDISQLTGGTFTYSAYSAVPKVMIFGQNNASFKLSTNRSITPIASPPFSFYDGSGYVAAIAADPVSGEFLALTPTNRDFYAFDVASNAWRRLSTPTKPDMVYNSVIAASVPNYGVVIFVACLATDCRMYVYKHAAGTGEPPAVTPLAPSDLSAD